MKPGFRKCQIAGWGVDPEVYHRQDAKRGAPDYALSPSSIKAFAQCPDRWLRGYESPDSKAKDWGNMVDTLALTPQAFAERYAVKPATYPAPTDHAKVKKGEIKEGDPLPWNANAKICEAWESEVKRDGRQPISEYDYNGVKMAAERLKADPKIQSFLEASDRQTLVVGEYVAENGIVIPVRCLIDLAPHKDSEFADCLGDLKTTRNAALGPFGRFCYQMGYHLQAAFDLDLFNASTSEARSTWCFIIQENYPPFQTGRRIFSQDYIDYGRRAYQSGLELYAKCLKSGKWPGYDETDEATQGWSVVSPSPWMENEDAFAPKFAIEAEELTEEETDLVP